MLLNFVSGFLAYLIDIKFGEFKFIKHPIITIGEIISYFEQNYYKDSILRGVYLVVFVSGITTSMALAIYLYLSQINDVLNIIITSFIASIFLAHKMLHDEVKKITTAKDKKAAIAMLVSRDTKDMSNSDVYKAAIETYAENLSDGVIAPLFYMLLFNLPGLVFYKTINTLDSMVGYRNKKYEKFGKAAAKLDDWLNFIPSRLTAVLIMWLFKQKELTAFYPMGQKHDSPNAGHPITAMALCLNVKLGGDTSYFGKVKKKAFFGKGREVIVKQDVLKALECKKKLDRLCSILFIITLILFVVIYFVRI